MPKSVTDNATRWEKRSASAAHDVPNAAARPGFPLSTTMSAVPASSMNRSRSAGFVGVQHGAAFVGVVQCERDAGARHGGRVAARGAAAGGLDLQHVGAQVGEQPGNPVGLGAAEIQHPQRRQQTFAAVHPSLAARSRCTHSK